MARDLDIDVDQPRWALTLRRALSGDVSSITALVHAAYAEHAERGLNFTAADQSDDTTRSRAFGGATWVIEAGGELVATATLSMPPGEGIRELSAAAREEHMAWLNQLAVHPDHRGAGHARLLFDRLIEHAGDSGAHSVGLDTAAPAAELRRLYRRWGFRDRELMHWPGKTYDSVVMVRSLL